MSSLLCFSIALLHLLSCFNEVTVTAAATTSICEKRCQQLFGNCLCYCELEESLLATEENTLNLTKAFFPPEANPPEFVTVIYSFEYTNDTTIITDRTWYWSEQTSHFIHPFEVFQFLSLFFGKPEPYYTGDLYVTLKAECGNITSAQDIDKLQLLTQRLKLYAERGNLGVSNLVLSDTYSAKAYDKNALREVLEHDTNRIINIIICTSIFVVFFSLVIIIILMITFIYSKSHTKSKWIEKTKEKKPIVLSLAVLSGIANVYIVSLVFSALGFWYTPSSKEDILHSFNTRINAAPLFTAFFTDILALILWLILMIAAGVTYYKMVNEDDSTSESSLWCTLQYISCCESYKLESKMIKHKRSNSMSKENAFIILSATVLCPIFCIIAHSPYIAIAYLNDGDHASSIFIYYTILCYILFGVIWLFFHWCQHFIDEDKKDEDKNDAPMTQDTNEKENGNQDSSNEETNEKENGNQDSSNEETKFKENENSNQDSSNEENYRVLGCCTIGEIERGIPNEATPKEQRRCFITAVIILLIVALLFLLGLIVVISCYFVLIPINKSISNAPNRLLSIYQSGGFLIGSFIVFNILKYFHAQRKKKDIGENVDKIHIILQNWLFHPKQQLYRLQEQLKELERESNKVQKQLSQQSTQQLEAHPAPTVHTEEITESQGDSPPAREDNQSQGDPPPAGEDGHSQGDPPPAGEDNQSQGDPPPAREGDPPPAGKDTEPQGTPSISRPPTRPGTQPQSKSLQNIRDLQKQLQQYRQQLDLLNQQSGPTEQWNKNLTEKLEELQDKLNDQERECQQQ